MFSTVIDKLSDLFGKRLLVASFFPLLVVAFVNVVLLRATSPGFREWLAAQNPALDAETFLTGAVALIGLAVLAVLLATLNTLLRELLEGKHWPRPLCRYFIPIETERLKKLDDEITDVRKQYWALRDAGSWTAELAAARKDTAGRVAGNYAGLPQAAADALQRLVTARQRGDLLPFADLALVKPALEAELRKYGGNKALDTEQVRFNDLLDYAQTRMDVELGELYSRKISSFGATQVMPTSIGNIAGALSTYAFSRYGLSLDFLWTRLQKVLQADTAYYDVVQDAKAQLDGIVMLFWLTTVSALFWLGNLAWWGFSLRLFFAIATVAPLLCIGLYRLAQTSYTAFADLLRSVVDLYRFELLKKLHLPLPDNAAEEQVAWEGVNRWIGFGETADFPYRHGDSA